ncbi:SHOCT domain-containing protein [Ornithinimicrobium flavum]|uniref:SHOCT domain-containing protein n=1 Tax=Ornithinimicrobium flavum TaxID=1288636 RepID=UPI001931031D|nr:SHOCT domain-containing protein [Ornithinimicrobium flavum]
MMGNGWGAGMGWMWIFWPLVILATVAVVALLVRSGGSERTRPPGPADHPPAHEADEPTAAAGQSAARRILDERYARGEIDEEDYRTRRRRLGEPDA